MGMVGGGEGSFIGAVHRTAAALDHRCALTAGAFSSDPARSMRSGRALGVPESRTYRSWREMAEREAALPPEQRIDFVAIVTPNDTHHDIARAFIDAGFHVVCDKPVTTTSADAQDLAEAAGRAGVEFCVTYNYSGYPLVRHARHLCRSGALGGVRKVIVEYTQGWLARALERRQAEGGFKQAAWRTDPAQAGAGGAIGDIGSHAEHLTRFVTGLEVEAICADLTAFVEGRALDDDASVLMRFKGGAKGVLTASQVCIGQENNLRLRVWGERGALDWSQENPNELRVWDEAGQERVLRRGNAGLAPDAIRATRLPPGHPEAFYEAFANIYAGFFESLAARANGQPFTNDAQFPTAHDGAIGVRFIEQTVENARSNQKWTRVTGE